MSIRTERWRFIGDRTGWPTMARTAFWSSRHPALLRAPPPTTPGEAVTWRHGPPIAIRYVTLCRAWHLWICGQPLRGCLCRQCVKPGLPTTPPAHHQRKEGAILFSVGRVLCRMTRFHRGTLPLALCTRGRTRTKRTHHELQKPDRLTSQRHPRQGTCSYHYTRQQRGIPL